MTNAEFLNENFGTDYKAWMKCSWKYNDKILVWMVNLDKSISAGWQNSIIDENTVHEIYVGALEHQIEGHRTVDEPYRLVVDKSQGYKILGVYKYDVLNSKERTCRIWKKVADSIAEFYNHQ